MYELTGVFILKTRPSQMNMKAPQKSNKLIAYVGPFPFPSGAASSRRVMGIADALRSGNNEVIIGAEQPKDSNSSTLAKLSDYNVSYLNEAPSNSNLRKGFEMFRSGTNALRWLNALRAILMCSGGVGLCGSDAMANEYIRRYGGEFHGFPVNVPSVSESPPPLLEETKGRPIRLAYIGGLHLNRTELLVDIGKACQVLCNQGLQVECVIYAPMLDLNQYGTILSSCPSIRVGGTLQTDEMSKIISVSDVMVHVESFDANILRYTHLSLSTKIPMYMSMARPILAYGPGHLASCRHVEQAKAGIVVPHRDIEKLSEAIRFLVLNQNARFQMGIAGWEQAKNRHDARNERNRLAAILGNAAKQRTLIGTRKNW